MAKFGMPTGDKFMISEIKALEAELERVKEENVQLKADLDKARREVCELFADKIGSRQHAKLYAKFKYWNCYD